MKIKEGSIVIVEDTYKEKFLKNFRREHPFFDVTVLGLRELKKKYYFDYSKEAVFYVHKKYDVISDVAQIYLENLYFLKSGVDSEKVNFLRQVKKDLDEQHLLQYDPVFKNFLKGKDVVLYHLDSVDNFYRRTFDEIKKHSNVYSIDKESGKPSKKPLYKLANRDAEVAFVASQIAELIKCGIAIDHIKLAGVNADYIFSLKKTFKDFKIPIELPVETTIGGTILISKFTEYFSSDIESTLEKIKPFIKSETDEYIFEKIVSCLNEYYWCSDYLEVKDFILKDLKKIKQKSTKLKHAVRTIDFLIDEIDDGDYVFLLNFNQGAIPKNKKDEDYLPDSTKLLLDLSDSIDINKKNVDKIRKKIAYTKNLVVTYSARNLESELYISNAYDESLFEKRDPHISFEHSNAYNRRLLTCEKDLNKKYGSSSEEMKILLNHYKNDPYCTYDNTFKGIDKEALKTFLQNKLVLSYSTMDHYYRCAFRYYLDYILKLDEFEDTFMTVIGTIFHEVLSVCFKENFDFEVAWTNAVSNQEFEFKKMEQFYLGLLKEELKFVIANLHEQTKMSKLHKALYEQKIQVPVEVGSNVFFKGFIDKIIYDDDSQVAAIIDYKTGTPDLDIDDIIYGLNMQLPVYAYLLKHFDPLKNMSIGGFYLQKILNNEKTEEEKKGALKLQGFSSANPRILGEVDTTYENSALIKSMKMSKGNFYSYAKVLSDEQIDVMIDLVEDKIKEAAKNILDGNFAIDPKEISGKNKGCEFCNYRDICYMKNDDIVKLKKQKKEDFLGGEINGLD